MQLHGLSLVTAPAEVVLSTADAKLHLRVDSSDEDALIAALVQAATQSAQAELRRALVTQTWDMTLDCWPDVIEVPFGATSVTSVSYIADEVAQVLASDLYVADMTRQPGRIFRADGVTWPSLDVRPNAVTVRFVAGFGAASAVPDGIKAWIKLHVGALYRNREAFAQGVSMAELPNRFTDSLLDPWRLVVV